MSVLNAICLIDSYIYFIYWSYTQGHEKVLNLDKINIISFMNVFPLSYRPFTNTFIAIFCYDINYFTKSRAAENVAFEKQHGPKISPSVTLHGPKWLVDLR